MKILFWILACLPASFLFAQEKKDLTISFGIGMINSPYYTNAKAQQFHSFDFAYNLNSRHKISTSLLGGKHLYYDSILSNNSVPLSTPGYENNTNSTARYLTFSLIYTYKLFRTKNISLNIGAGAGILHHERDYPYTSGNSVTFRESGWTDLVFPLKAEFDYNISRRLLIGIIAGTFIHPDYPLLGHHAGLRAGYVIK